MGGVGYINRVTILHDMRTYLQHVNTTKRWIHGTKEALKQVRKTTKYTP